ncbi:MAG: hypothetical protein J0M29_10185 [Chitinophagales bacterium]|nr:hypothetical protein [Chitinophagales bacterium]
MTHSFKTGAALVLCLLPTLASSQQAIAESVVPKYPAWRYGLHFGAGFTSQKLIEAGSAQYYSSSYYAQGQSLSNARFAPYSEYAFGGFLTRQLNDRWSLRSEMTYFKRTYGSTALGVGLFPRYRVLPWLQLEAGVEARQTLSGRDGNDSRLWLGAVVGRNGTELSFRYAPGYTQGVGPLKGAFMGTTQVTLSVPLNGIGNAFKRKR